MARELEPRQRGKVVQEVRINLSSGEPITHEQVGTVQILGKTETQVTLGVSGTILEGRKKRPIRTVDVGNWGMGKQSVRPRVELVVDTRAKQDGITVEDTVVPPKKSWWDTKPY